MRNQINSPSISNEELLLLKCLKRIKDNNNGPWSTGWVRPMDVSSIGNRETYRMLNHLVKLGCVISMRRNTLSAQLGSKRAGKKYCFARMPESNVKIPK